MISFREQLIWIIYYLLFGYFLAAANDILMYFLNKTKMNTVLKYIIQLFFWLGLAYLATSYMMRISEGYLTIYTFGFFAIGALIHLSYFSKHFRNDLDRLTDFLKKVLSRVKKLLIIIVFPKEVMIFLRRLLPKKQSIINLKKKFLKLFKKNIVQPNDKE
ncbi:MAG: hypothetical protein GX661_05835 [Acholeplasmataceae bacterium]|nr:hypothetical protein [Acholeplasmataceae bacterium]